MLLAECGDLGGIDFSIRMRQGKDLMSRGFHRSRLMTVNMAGLRADHSLMGPKPRRDHRHIGLCASDQEMDRQLFIPAGPADQGGRIGTMPVLSIAHRLFHIGFHQFFHHLRMGAFVIVALK